MVLVLDDLSGHGGVASSTRSALLGSSNIQRPTMVLEMEISKCSVLGVWPDWPVTWRFRKWIVVPARLQCSNSHRADRRHGALQQRFSSILQGNQMNEAVAVERIWTTTMQQEAGHGWFQFGYHGHHQSMHTGTGTLLLEEGTTTQGVDDSVQILHTHLPHCHPRWSEPCTTYLFVILSPYILTVYSNYFLTSMKKT